MPGRKSFFPDTGKAKKSSVVSHDLIVCAYKDSPFLPECIESLVNQDSESAKVKICTSTPSEYIYSVAKSFGIEVLVNPHCQGIASDWNFALDSACGDFVTLCHQDDVYRENYSSTMLGVMTRFPEVLIGFCGNMEYTALGERPMKLNLRIKKVILRMAFFRKVTHDAKKVRRRLLSLGNPVCCPSVIINNRLLHDFRFCSHFKSNLDWDAWDVICGRKGEVAYIPAPLVSHRVHEGSETSAVIANKTRFQEDYEMFCRYWPECVCKIIMFLYRFSYKGNKVC